ncbi:uncharacterized lipoprotein YehR (DUF1307 family) [Breznakia sp. PF5-3]|nr:uncharacterized lipoprotein YehR (DUF1307 family) [Breznakia sp. PM6-1]MDF9836228.1 uncharacterized lipoprotein YehR (DUF1307 family) [Breznakia sp. PF5-3]MDF9838532.1 uncharacterized lipoprotein YehR (DUF1307 family) [Breznakia sp. PFB2-8]MDF9860473.1 uncharacterized lipoprotein YehR (DUF1307 family) [Breznakia sp. PH5-24]
MKGVVVRIKQSEKGVIKDISIDIEKVGLSNLSKLAYTFDEFKKEDYISVEKRVDYLKSTGPYECKTE